MKYLSWKKFKVVVFDCIYEIEEELVEVEYFNRCFFESLCFQKWKSKGCGVY